MNLYTKTVVELKEIARGYGLPVSGNKSVLIQRIQHEETLGFEDFPDEGENVDEEIGGYILLFTFGGPHLFFNEKETLAQYTYKFKGKNVNKIVPVPKNKIHITRPKKSVAYYSYQGYSSDDDEEDETNVFGVFSTKTKLFQFEKENGRKLAGKIKGQSSYMSELRVIQKNQYDYDSDEEETPKKKSEPKKSEPKYYVAYLMMDSETFIEGIFDSFEKAKEKLNSKSFVNKSLEFIKDGDRWKSRSSYYTFYIEEKVLNL